MIPSLIAFHTLMKLVFSSSFSAIPSLKRSINPVKNPITASIARPTASLTAFQALITISLKRSLVFHKSMIATTTIAITTAQNVKLVKTVDSAVFNIPKAVLSELIGCNNAPITLPPMVLMLPNSPLILDTRLLNTVLTELKIVLIVSIGCLM